MQNALVPHLHVMLKIQERYLNAEGPLRSEGFQPHTGSLAQASSAGEKSPQLLTMKTMKIVAKWDEHRLESQADHLKGTHMDLLADILLSSELQCWDRSLKSAGDTQEITELSHFRERAKEAASSNIEVLAEATLSLLGPKPTQLVPQKVGAIAESPSLFAPPW